MKLLNGMIFGAGTGLVTAGIIGVSESLTLITIGLILILAETSRFLYRIYHRTENKT